MENKLTGFLFDRAGVPRFQKYLDLSSLRHRLTSANVANVSTPGYKSRDIDFRAEYENAIGQGNHLAGSVTHRNHIPVGRHQSKPPKIAEAKVATGDMNSVDIDREISSIAQNELRFSVGAKLLQMKFAGLRKVITNK